MFDPLSAPQGRERSSSVLAGMRNRAMKRVALLFALALSVTLVAAGGDKKTKITTNPQDAEIWVNGKKIAAGTTTISIPDNGTVDVAVKKFGFVSQDRSYTNNKVTPPPKLDHFSLVKDPSIDSSTSTDIANKDIDIKTDKSEDDAWRLISQIVTSSFDVIEVTDRNTGYLRTAWTVKRFDPGSSVRTRLIIKMGNASPLVYKVKIVSEVAIAGSSPKDDEKWSEWDRLLRTFIDIVPEIQSRLSKL
jgi:hypothetical protein